MRKGWEYKKLGEVATFINGDRGKNYPSAKDFVESGVPFINAGHLNNGIISYDKMNYITINKYNSLGSGKIIKNDILFCLRGSLGKYAIVAEDSMGAIASSLVIIRPFQNADNRFIAHFLSSAKIKEYIAKNNNGSSQPNLSAKSVASFIIPLPTLSTQLAIVSELDKINELIRLKKEQLKDFDNLAQSLFYEMFGDPVENEKGWEVKKLKDISREIGDGLHGTPEYSEVDTGCYFINGNNLENGTIVIKENTKMVSEKTKTKHYIEMDDFTILVSINGTLGKVAFYNGENVILGKSACYIKLEAYNDKKYIFELLKSDYFKRCAENECTGTTIRNVSLKSMRNFRCPLPPLPLQRLFAQRIEQIEREKSEVQKSIQDLETLLASRIQYWFE